MLFILFLLISQICWQINSIPYGERENLNNCTLTLNTQQWQLYGQKCMAESLNFSLAFDINITGAGFFENNCKWVFICYTSSFGENVKPHMKLRNENIQNNVTEACGDGIQGIGVEICGLNLNGTKSSELKSLELSFAQKIIERENPNGKSNILVELHSLLTLWNVERLKLLKHIRFYNGRNALQKIANLWLIPIDIFGGGNKNKLEMFYLAPDEILVHEMNELLNVSNCTSTTLNSAISTTTDTEPTLAPCVEDCQNEIDEIVKEIIEMEENCKLEELELPPEAKARETVNNKLHWRTSFELPCTDSMESIMPTLEMAQGLLESAKKRCHNDESAIGIDHKIHIKTWTSPIHYIINKTIYVNLPEIIHEAIKMIEEETCISFEEMHGNDVNLMNDLPFLQFTDAPNCFSSLGQAVAKGPQIVGMNLIFAAGEIVHLILHALGVPQEELRGDRDENVWINWENIKPEERFKFDKLVTDLFDTSYDFGSIMHSGPIANSWTKKKYTLITKDPDFQHTIGQRAKMSFKDVKLLNNLYKCYQNCTKKCFNGGYPDPKNCEICKCPAPFEGEFCESDNKCVPILPSNEQHFYESEYNSHKCIKLQVLDEVAAVTITEISPMNSFNCPITCEKFYVEVKWTANLTATGARFCCREMIEMAPIRIRSEESTDMYLLLVGEISVKFVFEKMETDQK